MKRKFKILNPYVRNPAAIRAWDEVRNVYLVQGVEEALHAAKNYDKNLGTQLVKEIGSWSSKENLNEEWKYD